MPRRRKNSKKVSKTYVAYNRLKRRFSPVWMLAQLVATVGQSDVEVSAIVENITGIDLEPDGNGNFYVSIPKADGKPSSTLFLAHLDTVARCRTDVKMEVYLQGNHVFMRSDGASILGADDRAGCAILAFMMTRKVPGTYYFFRDEELGRGGSIQASKDEKGLILKGKDLFKRAIQFDRYGYDSIICQQSGFRTASEPFAKHLAAAFQKNGVYRMKADLRGSYTDSYSMCGTVPECTNISVGYFKHHTKNEIQNLSFLDTLARACVKIDWDNIVTARTPAAPVSYTHGYRNSYSAYEDYNSHGVGQGSLFIKQSEAKLHMEAVFADDPRNFLTLVIEESEQRLRQTMRTECDIISYSETFSIVSDMASDDNDDYDDDDEGFFRFDRKGDVKLITQGRA